MWRRWTMVWGLVVCATHAARGTAEDWPRFRGVNGSGVSSSIGLPTEFGPDTQVAWSVPAGPGISSPVIAQGKLYLTSADGDQRRVQCLDVRTGEQLWEQTLAKVRDENASRPNGPATCTPAVAEDNVVVFFPDTALLCYADTGELRWRVEPGPFHSMHGIASSPVIVDGKVLVLADQIQGSFLAAFDLRDGAQLWKVDRVDGVTGGYSTPSVTTTANHAALVLATGPQGLFAYKAASGTMEFTVPGVANAPVTVPVVDGNMVYLCEPTGEGESMEKYVPAFDKDKDGRLSLDEVQHSIPFHRLLSGIDQRFGNGDGVVEESEWNAAFDTMLGKGGLLAIDLAPSDGSAVPAVRWTYTRSVPYVASPVHYDGVLYVIRDQGVFMSVNPDDGSVLKTGRLKKGGAQFYASPVAADGKVFVVDTAGRMTVLQADPQWEELWATELGESVYATPAICDGRLFVRTETKLYCFGQPWTDAER